VQNRLQRRNGKELSKKEGYPPNCAEHNFILIARNRRGAKKYRALLFQGLKPLAIHISPLQGFNFLIP
jgi:hypothetical protein